MMHGPTKKQIVGKQDADQYDQDNLYDIQGPRHSYFVWRLKIDLRFPTFPCPDTMSLYTHTVIGAAVGGAASFPASPPQYRFYLCEVAPHQTSCWRVDGTACDATPHTTLIPIASYLPESMDRILLNRSIRSTIDATIRASPASSKNRQ